MRPTGTECYFNQTFRRHCADIVWFSANGHCCRSIMGYLFINSKQHIKSTGLHWHFYVEEKYVANKKTLHQNGTFSLFSAKALKNNSQKAQIVFYSERCVRSFMLLTFQRQTTFSPRWVDSRKKNILRSIFQSNCGSDCQLSSAHRHSFSPGRRPQKNLHSSYWYTSAVWKVVYNKVLHTVCRTIKRSCFL